ncbi:ankyrin repeat-containing domain protein [Tricladium varicosporioides]|nr:ankyrin repeat-containing domain protein [Hymenoscyphus varicosporioides]
MASFFTLSNELLLQVCIHLTRQDDLWSLALLCAYHHAFFNNQLYTFNLRRRQSKGLFWAAERGRFSTVKIFLDILANSEEISSKIDEVYPYDFYDPYTWPRQGKTSLSLAVQGGHGDVVKLLLEAGALSTARDKKGRTYLFWALASKNDEAISMIVATIPESQLRGEIVDLEHEFSPLHMATRHGLPKWTRRFLELGVEVDGKDKHGWTALRHVLATDYIGYSDDTYPLTRPSAAAIVETVKILIGFGADPILHTIQRWGWECEDVIRGTTKTYSVVAANLGVRHMDPAVRALFTASVETHENYASVQPRSEEGREQITHSANLGVDKSDTPILTPYELGYLQAKFHPQDPEVLNLKLLLPLSLEDVSRALPPAPETRSTGSEPVLFPSRYRCEIPPIRFTESAINRAWIGRSVRERGVISPYEQFLSRPGTTN